MNWYGSWLSALGHAEDGGRNQHLSPTSGAIMLVKKRYRISKQPSGALTEAVHIATNFAISNLQVFDVNQVLSIHSSFLLKL